jgi:hypothetical protein
MFRALENFLVQFGISGNIGLNSLNLIEIFELFRDHMSMYSLTDFDIVVHVETYFFKTQEPK